MNFFKVIATILDFLGKNLSRIKTIGLIVLVILFGIAMAQNGCQRSEVERLVERITGLNVSNDILRKDVKERDSLIIAKDERIKRLRDSLFASEARQDQLEVAYGRLEAKYRTLSDSLLTIPTDSSYSFLVKEAYPYPGHLRYPFNEPQVKGIHLTYLERQSLENMNANLLGQIDEMSYQLVKKDTIAEEQAVQIMLMTENRADLEEMIGNKDQIIQDKDKQINRERARKTIWQIAGGVIVTIVAILGFSGG